MPIHNNSNFNSMTIEEIKKIAKDDTLSTNEDIELKINELKSKGCNILLHNLSTN